MVQERLFVFPLFSNRGLPHSHHQRLPPPVANVSRRLLVIATLRASLFTQVHIMYIIIWNFCVFVFIVAPSSHNVRYHFHLQSFTLSFLFSCSSPCCSKGLVSWLFCDFAFLFFVLVSVLMNQFVVSLFIHINHSDVLIKVWWRTIYILLYFWAFICWRVLI